MCNNKSFVIPCFIVLRRVNNDHHSFPLRFLPVYLVSGLVSLPFLRLRSFFSRIQSRDFFSGFPRAFFSRSLQSVLSTDDDSGFNSHHNWTCNY